jgi:hypothetical protein
VADPVERARAEVFGTLAERINDQHRACLGAASMALAHALVAGDLLLEVKKGVKHREWGAWLEKNFEGSQRTAQVYMLLARRRDEIEEAEAQSSAVFSIADALRALTAPVLPPSWSLPGLGPSATPTEKEREQEARRTARERAREREQRRMLERAEYAIRSGNFDPPPEIEGAKWQHVLYEASQLREQNVPHVIDALGHNLHILLRHADPEAVGRHLGEPTNDYDKAENREGLIEELREGVAWLTKVIEEAEAVRRREG